MIYLLIQLDELKKAKAIAVALLGVLVVKEGYKQVIRDVRTPAPAYSPDFGPERIIEMCIGCSMRAKDVVGMVYSLG